MRALAAEWGLPVWDKPAAPCLSSRVAYGEEVTPERLAMIDRAEQYLRPLGLRELRVRYHRGDMARLEVPPRRARAALRAGDPQQRWWPNCGDWASATSRSTWKVFDRAARISC